MPDQSSAVSGMLDAYLGEYHTVAEQHLAIGAGAKTDTQVSWACGATRSSKSCEANDAGAVKELDKQMHEMTDACMLLEARKAQQSLDKGRDKA